MSSRRFKAAALSRQELVFIYKVLAERWEEYPSLVNTGGKTKSSRQLLITEICDMLVEMDGGERRTESQIAERFKHDVTRIRSRISREDSYESPALHHPLPFYLEELEDVIRAYDLKHNPKPESEENDTPPPQDSQEAEERVNEDDDQPKKKCQTLTPPELRIFYQMLYDGLDRYMAPGINGKGKVQRQRLMAEIAGELNLIPSNIQRSPNQIFERAKQIFKRINERINYEKAAESGDFQSYRNVQIPNDMVPLFEKEKARQQSEIENEDAADDLDSSSVYEQPMLSTNSFLDIIVKEEEFSCSVMSNSASTIQPVLPYEVLEFNETKPDGELVVKENAEVVVDTRPSPRKRPREEEESEPPTMETSKPADISPGIQEKRAKIVDKEMEYWDVKIATERKKLEVLDKVDSYIASLLTKPVAPVSPAITLKSLVNLVSAFQ